MQTERDVLGYRSGRVRLRPHDRKDFPLYERWYADPEIWNLSSWRPSPMEPAETRRLFDDRKSSGSDVSLAVHVRDPGNGTDGVIGVIGLMNVSQSTRSADLSIIIGSPEHRQKGYGTEAMGLMLDHAFTELGLKRVALSVFDFNETALKTYEKLGFGYEGKIADAVTRDDGPHDAILMAITARQWRRRRSG